VVSGQERTAEEIERALCVAIGNAVIGVGERFPELRGPARFVFGVMRMHAVREPNGDVVCRVVRRRIAESSGFSRRTVDRARDALVGVGAIVRDHPDFENDGAIAWRLIDFGEDEDGPNLAAPVAGYPQLRLVRDGEVAR